MRRRPSYASRHRAGERSGRTRGNLVSQCPDIANVATAEALPIDGAHLVFHDLQPAAALRRVPELDSAPRIARSRGFEQNVERFLRVRVEIVEHQRDPLAGGVSTLQRGGCLLRPVPFRAAYAGGCLLQNRNTDALPAHSYSELKRSTCSIVVASGSLGSRSHYIGCRSRTPLAVPGCRGASQYRAPRP